MKTGDNAVIDYTEEFRSGHGLEGSFLLVHGKGRNVLILSKLDEPRKRFDGKKAGYELEYRWLSQDCQTCKDEAYVCVQGSEITLWQVKEFDLKALKEGRKTLFDCFELIG